MKKTFKILKILALLAIAFIALVVILYISGIEDKQYHCTLNNKYQVTLRSYIDNNSFLDNAYDLTLTISYNGLIEKYDLESSKMVDVTICSVIMEKENKQKEYLIAIAPNTSVLIDAETLKMIDFEMKLSKYGSIISQKTIAIPGCISKDIDISKYSRNEW